MADYDDPLAAAAAAVNPPLPDQVMPDAERDLLGEEVARLNREAAAAPPAQAAKTAAPTTIPSFEDDPLGHVVARDAAAAQAAQVQQPDIASAPTSDRVLTVTRQAPQPNADASSGDPLGDLENFAPPGSQTRTLADAGNQINDDVRMAANGATLGFAPRIAAAVGAATGIGGTRGDYAGNLAAQNAADAEIRKEAPIGSRIAEGAGAVLGLAASPLTDAAAAVRGAPLLTKAAVGKGTGAAIGATQGAAKSPDLTSWDATKKTVLPEAKSGATIGAVLPAAGSAIGSVYGVVAPFFGAGSAPGLGRVATGLLANAVTPQTADRLAALGEHGMMADASPGLLGLAQGVAAKGGAPANTVVDALSDRAAGQSDRLLSSLNENLGSASSPREVQAMMDARRTAAGLIYEDAMRNAPYSVDISPVLRTLETEQLSAKGGVAQDLGRFEGLLQSPYRVNGMTRPEYDPRALHAAKEAMDVAIARTTGQTGSAAATATRSMSRVRSALNDALEDQVPGYAQANLAYRTAAQGGENYTAGRQALKAGEDVMWPQDLAHEFANLPLEQQALYRAGARSQIAQGLGTNPNDLSSLNKVLGGENDFNRPKMATLFGPEQAGNVVRDVANERQFADTYNKVAQNTQTAQRLGNAAAIDAAQPQYVIPKSGSLTGLLGHAGEFATRKVLGALAQSSGQSTRQALADALIAGSPKAATNLQDLAQALMAHRTVSQIIGDATGGPSAMAAALLARPPVQR